MQPVLVGVQVKAVFRSNARTADGDLKKARDQMRNVVAPSNHHFSVFRSGFLIGLSIPAIIVGAYHGKPDSLSWDSNKENDL